MVSTAWSNSVIEHEHSRVPRSDLAFKPRSLQLLLRGFCFRAGRKRPGSHPRHIARAGSDHLRIRLDAGIDNLLLNLLDIEVPMISAINGPALRHSEIPLLCDIVLAAEDTTFQDSAHFANGLVPGDGMHIVYPLLLGMNRGRYFLLTGQTLTARQAHELGLVAEVLPRQDLLPRAWALAEQLAQRPPLVLRYSRVLLTQQLKRLMHDLLGYGLALEGLGVADAQMSQDG